MDELKYKDGKFTVNGAEIASGDDIATISANTQQFSVIDTLEYIEVKLDSDGKIVEGISTDGTKVVNVNSKFKNVSIETLTTDSLTLSDEALTDFEQALKDHGFRPGGAGDWSEAKELQIPEPRCAYINITKDGGNAVWPTSKTDDYHYWMEFNDMQGNMFKKRIIFNAQGNSSMSFVKKNGAIDLCNDEWIGNDTFKIKFGDWVVQDSFHLKAYYTDFFRGVALIAYQIANEVELDNDILSDRPWKRSLLSNYTFGSDQTNSEQVNDLSLQLSNEARCMPDGFPCIVHLNGYFYGIYMWNIKKHRDNYHMEKDNANNIHLDGTVTSSTLFSANGDSSKIGWAPGNDDGFEVRNPKGDYFVTTAGTQYNADATTSQELAGLSALNEEIPTWSSANTYSALDRVIVGERMYLSRVDNNTEDPTKANYKKPSKVWDSATANWVEITFTNEVKKKILTVSTYIPEIKATSSIEDKKTLFEKYFDKTSLIDYECVQLATGDNDGFGKNWQWVTYDGVKWFVCEYDKDMSFGGTAHGMYTQKAPTVGGWMGNDINNPMGMCISLYKDEIKARWQELYDKKIINYNNFISKFLDLTNRIGTINYEKEYEKWPDSPCNRDSLINTDWDVEYTRAIRQWNVDTTYPLNSYQIRYSRVYRSLIANNKGNDPATDDGTKWEDVSYDTNRIYNVGEYCFYGIYGYMKFIANKETQNPPLDGFYNMSPYYLGYRDSIWRVENYIKQRIDVINNWINNL